MALLYVSMTHYHFFSGRVSYRHVLDKHSLLSMQRWQSTEHYYIAATTLKKFDVDSFIVSVGIIPQHDTAWKENGN